MSAMLSCSVVKFTIFNAALSISVTSDNVTEEGADVDAVMKEALKNCKKVEDDCEIFL